MLRGAALGSEPLEHADGRVGVDVALDEHLKRLAGVFVHDVEQLQDAPVDGLVELKIERPHLVGPFGPQPLGRDRRLSKASALAPPLRYPQSLLSPAPLHPLAVDLPAQLPQVMVRPPIPPPRSLDRNARSSERNAA